jgi:glycosyltransferase involved in cell wall biosynthesis
MATERILHVLWHMDIGGAERALYQLVREQRRHGIAADIMLGLHAGYYGEKAREAGAMVIELGQKNSLDMSVAPRVAGILGGYDIVHFHGAELGMMRMAARARNVRRYYTHRGGIFDYPARQRLRYLAAGFYLRRRFAALSGNTDQGAAAASQLFGIPIGEIMTTYNGIDFSLLDPKRSAEAIRQEIGMPASGQIAIGTSANLRDWKRIDLLIEAMARPGVDAHCYIIGDGPARASLEQQVARLGIGDRVTFTGKKEHVGDYLQTLDIFVLPSGPEESFGNSAVEAMGVGLPTIVFRDGGGLPEHIEHGRTGYIVDDLDDLARTLARLVADPAEREKIGSTARETIRKKYSLDAMVEGYQRLYERSRESGVESRESE